MVKKGDRFYRSCYFALFSLALTGTALHLLTLAEHTYLWSDELFGWWVAVQTSWSGLWQAMYRGSDGMFPAFYVFSWCWSRLFGGSEIALRLPSILFTLGGGAACFLLIRRLWGSGAACVSVGAMILGNKALLIHAAQFRGYGMLLGLIAFSLCWLVLISPDHPRRRSLLSVHAATQFLLCLTHPFGVLYSAALGLGKCLANLTATRRVWDWGLLWSYVPAALGLLIWLPGMRAVARLNHPHGWVPPVTVNDLAKLAVPTLDTPWGSGAIFLALALLLVCGALTRPQTEAFEPADSFADERRTAIILAVAILAVGPAVWVLSLIVEPLLVARYFLPAVWGWAILGAAVWGRLAPSVSRPVQLLTVVSVLAFSGLGLVCLHYPTFGPNSSAGDSLISRAVKERAFVTGYVDRFFISEKAPVFVEGIHNFLTRDHYNPGKFDYRLLLNQQAAVEGRDVKGASIETNLALKLCENGMPAYKVVDVRDAREVIEVLPTFYIIDLKERTTVNGFLDGLRARGWREEVVSPDIFHPVAGAGVIKKFSRPQ